MHELWATTVDSKVTAQAARWQATCLQTVAAAASTRIAAKEPAVSLSQVSTTFLQGVSMQLQSQITWLPTGCIFWLYISL